MLAETKLNKIYQIDCVEGMKQLPEKSIDLTVTSPPYDDLRKYNGFTFDFENVTKELYRITKPGGVVVWVVGDATIKGSETLTSFKQAMYFKEIGFNVHDTMIYLKKNTMPRQRNRYEQAFEYMFIFSKGKPITYNLRRVPCKRAGVGSFRTARDSGKDELVKTYRTVADTKIDVNVWEYEVGMNMTTKDKIAFKHPAIFPEKLAEDHILSWSNEEEIVFDPFSGSGTTLKMAKLNNRKYIGFEISPEYIEIANKRIENT